MIRSIGVDEAINISDAVMVDVRSEDEYQEASIPGAVNVPLLNNEERARVGTQYKQVNHNSARRLGLEIVSPKLAEMVKAIDTLVSPGKKVVLFCWRGGTRSQFVAYMLDQMGFEVFRIEGGYKSYRRYVNAYFNSDLPHKAVVIHGLTGVGKTLVLKKLIEEGMPGLDLEGLAVHRGSVFGKVGLPPSPTQKTFEGLVFQELKKAEQKGIFIVECESRRLGRLLVPSPVLNSMKKGSRILVHAPLAVRVKRSVEEYFSGKTDVIPELLMATAALVKYLGHGKVEMLKGYITGGQVDKAVEFLLTNYYDPLYKYPDKPDSGYDLSVDTTDLDLAVNKICNFVRGLTEYNVPVNGGIPNGNRECSEKCEIGKGDIPGSCGGEHQDTP
ncbi:MAG: tRNA 2-selenouridine synthase [Peptococcaceae bacterium BRH_c4a]|nr:MAG: tRNA 2-selenouridine synthase [Peptococcaceae bacterium BRH_c4a]